MSDFTVKADPAALEGFSAHAAAALDGLAQLTTRYTFACAEFNSVANTIGGPIAARGGDISEAEAALSRTDQRPGAYAKLLLTLDTDNSGRIRALTSADDDLLDDFIRLGVTTPALTGQELESMANALAGKRLDKEQEDQGRAAGRRLRYLLANDSYREAEALLRELPDASTRDPGFGAALLNELPPRSVIEFYADLTSRSVGGWREPGRGERVLSRLHNAATHTWETPSAGSTLDRALVEELAGTADGRNTLRGLLVTSELAAGTAYLDHLVVPLLLDHDAAHDGLGAAARSLSGADGRSEGDAAVLAAVGRNPTAAAHLVSVEMGGHPVKGRIARLYSVARHGAQDELAAVLAAAVRHPDLAGGDRDVERHDVIDDVMVEVAADPGAVREPLATWLADTTSDDPDFWKVTLAPDWSTEAKRAQATAAFEAMASHDESFSTVIKGLEKRERRSLAGAVKRAVKDEPTDGDLEELSAITSQTDQLMEGAKRADRPADDWAWAFTAADIGLDAAEAAIPANRGAKVIVRPAADAGLSYAHEKTKPRPGNKANLAETQALRRRRNAWVAVAQDPDRAEHLGWDAGDSSIHDLDDLKRVADDTDDRFDLHRWEKDQPDTYRSLVDNLVMEE